MNVWNGSIATIERGAASAPYMTRRLLRSGNACGVHRIQLKIMNGTSG
jgi:hypothetical protein